MPREELKALEKSVQAVAAMRKAMKKAAEDMRAAREKAKET